jgi:DNA-binding transcriptional regulator YdaS (Cro superfamily)
MKTLNEYLKARGIKKTWLAKELGCSNNYIILICNGRRKPSTMLAKAIERFTEGQVKAQSFFLEKTGTDNKANKRTAKKNKESN